MIFGYSFCHACVSGSSKCQTDTFPGGFPQPCHVTFRQQAEESFVFPVEVRRVMVTDAVGHTCRVEALIEHEAVSILESQPFLELQGAHCYNGLEVVMKPRDAHSNRKSNGCRLPQEPGEKPLADWFDS